VLLPYKLFFLFVVTICLNESEDNKRVHNRVNVLTDMSQPHGVFWTDKSKTTVVVKFQDQVEQVHAFFKRCRASLAMVWGMLFPLNPLSPTLLALMYKFKSASMFGLWCRMNWLPGLRLHLPLCKLVSLHLI
jgi:hypothetical protein